MRIIVDGYNLLWAVPDLRRRMLREDAAGARLGLAALLAPVARGGREVTLVFDGAPSPGESFVPRTGRAGQAVQVAVRFCAPGETADDLIRRLVARLAEELLEQSRSVRAQLWVVTSDRELGSALKFHGARVLGAQAFLEQFLPEAIGKKPPREVRPPPLRHHARDAAAAPVAPAAPAAAPAPLVPPVSAADQKPPPPSAREVEEWLRIFGLAEEEEP